MKSALSVASSATPDRPVTRPATRPAPRRSCSQTAPISAVRIGTVAFRIEASPAVIDSVAQAISTNGIALLNRPITVTCPRRARSTPTWPRHSSSGSRQALAIATRSHISGSTPKAGAA